MIKDSNENFDYLRHWIINLVSDETIKLGFDNWLGDLSERYTAMQIHVMVQAWSERVHQIRQTETNSALGLNYGGTK